MRVIQSWSLLASILLNVLSLIKNVCYLTSLAKNIIFIILILLVGAIILHKLNVAWVRDLLGDALKPGRSLAIAFLPSTVDALIDTVGLAEVDIVLPAHLAS